MRRKGLCEWWKQLTVMASVVWCFACSDSDEGVKV